MMWRRRERPYETERGEGMTLEEGRENAPTERREETAKRSLSCEKTKKRKGRFNSLVQRRVKWVRFNSFDL